MSSHLARARKRSKRKHHAGMNEGTVNTLAAIKRQAERDEEIRAQHGPVKILMKDGKPVEHPNADEAPRSLQTQTPRP